MPPNDYSIHQAFTRRIPESEGEGWEFWCVDCGYRIRYTESVSSTGPLLHILNAGDPTVRHTSNKITIEQSMEGSDSSMPAGTGDLIPDDQLLLEEDIAVENWITPEISAILQQILARLDV